MNLSFHDFFSVSFSKKVTKCLQCTVGSKLLDVQQYIYVYIFYHKHNMRKRSRGNKVNWTQAYNLVVHLSKWKLFYACSQRDNNKNAHCTLEHMCSFVFAKRNMWRRKKCVANIRIDPPDFHSFFTSLYFPRLLPTLFNAMSKCLEKDVGRKRTWSAKKFISDESKSPTRMIKNERVEGKGIFSPGMHGWPAKNIFLCTWYHLWHYGNVGNRRGGNFTLLFFTTFYVTYL